MKESKDILTLFEALNNHEVFTPPRVARAMLDLIPADIWNNPDVRLLDPCTKSGVFLREAFFRFYSGLAGQGVHMAHDGVEYDLNDRRQRINHILRNMLFGIATSELTGYVARRTLYGVMEANTDKQIAAIDSFQQSSNYHEWSEEEQGNFLIRNTFNEYYDHTLFCTPDYEGFETEGNIFYPADEVARKVVENGSYEIEDMYYPFIEADTKHAKILDIRGGEMKFDVIIGNPPYQKSDGGDAEGRARGGAVPIYNKFVEAANQMNPSHLVMIIPSRWFSGGRGLDVFRTKMLEDRRISEIHDFPSSMDCFPGVSIKGGVCYFHRGSEETENCKIYTHDGSDVSAMERPLLEDGADVFIRFNHAVSIYRKVDLTDVAAFSSIVSNQKPFGLRTFEKGSDKKTPMSVSLFTNDGVRYTEKGSITANKEHIDSHKVFITMAYGAGETFPHQIINKPLYAPPGSACTETYLMIGPFESKEQADNAISYMKTKFFRFLVLLRKSTQHAARGVYKFVPMQDFSEYWTDDKLFQKYGLDDVEISFIEKMIREMV